MSLSFKFTNDVIASNTVPDPTVADAVLDRIVHKAHRISLKGESMRKVMAKKTFQAV